ncbi:MAG: hypothetical protein K9J37_22105 [Saprospiraceae bacterium]|nr:hypothetical protein [Saprospiraceae bacterium]MCF8252616.1 hypothetical protein [Saprospiraceae bacterium]MCF8282675.1 hypothetical protein [Bacteroidales bacterium]MCF8314178.1 hypothetical protein [Saprospiraceae bacterium]MCF8442968.1 hypothetical protein [Saprospiraceae bacterium]
MSISSHRTAAHALIFLCQLPFFLSLSMKMTVITCQMEDPAAVKAHLA